MNRCPHCHVSPGAQHSIKCIRWPSVHGRASSVEEVPVVVSADRDLDTRGNSPEDVPLPGSWRCECGDLNRDHEAFCYRCGAGQPEDEDEPCSTCAGECEVHCEAQIGVPGSGGMSRCPDCVAVRPASPPLASPRSDAPRSTEPNQEADRG